jgi:hypothetical protein
MVVKVLEPNINIWFWADKVMSWRHRRHLKNWRKQKSSYTESLIYLKIKR